jgi:hypothetical protein
MSSKPKDKPPFTIKRAGTRALKRKKAAATDPATDPAPQKPREGEAQADTPTTIKPPTDVNQPKTAKERKQYERRQPLTPLERDFLKDFYYKRSGYTGRDTLYRQLQAHYEEHETPKHLRISRRRMAEWLDAQEVNQLHRAARKHSLSIKPITAKDKLNAAQADLIIRGRDPTQKYKGILTFVDVSTRKAYTRLITSTTSKHVSEQIASILDQARNEMTAADKEARKGKRSETWSILHTDNGSEFQGETPKLLKARGITHVLGISNKSTGQALVERFNGTLQAAMARERTATKEDWWNLVEKHTNLYNAKPHRLLRLRETADAPYRYYAPDELWKIDAPKLAALYATKSRTLAKGNKDVTSETMLRVGASVLIRASPTKVHEVYKLKRPKKADGQTAEGKRKPYQFYLRDPATKTEQPSPYTSDLLQTVPFTVGDTVRIVDQAKRKAALAKGFTQNWSQDLYTVYKLRLPKPSEASRPIRFYVKDEDGDERTDNNGRPQPFTERDLLAIRHGVDKAPDDIQKKDDKKTDTRSGQAPKAAMPKPPKAPKPAPKPHRLIGVKVTSPEDDGDEGEVVAVFQKGKGKKKGPYYGRIRWKKPVTDEEGEVELDDDGKEVFETEMPLATPKGSDIIGLNEYIKQFGLNK